MTDRAHASFDTERLDARLSHVDAGLDAVSSDLERLNRLATLGTAAGMIAHEIRGLLTPVQAYAQMARQSPGDTELVLKALEKAEQGSAAAVRISETILALVAGVNRDEVPGPSDETAAAFGIDVGEVVDRAFEAVLPVLEDAGVTPDVRVDPRVRAAMGEVELQQVLVNLFENAAKAMKGGGVLAVTGRCSTGNTPDQAGTVEIEIADTGAGIDAAVVERVFEPFFTAGAGSAPGAAGAGLGLALCRALIAQARGRISVSSERGSGTRFRIVLPAAS
ncbi:MAG: hypothetical protein DHS20C14_05150 [Phycisphaeraceae bacterium]|nr:MAG: hypothetical protein DHS20C14_05150 [Phycisphaeraceae bacterium]